MANTVTKSHNVPKSNHLNLNFGIKIHGMVNMKAIPKFDIKFDISMLMQMLMQHKTDYMDRA